MKSKAVKWMEFLARIISGLWAGFWIFFAVSLSAADYNSRGGASLGGLVFPVLFTAILLLLALTAWRWVKAGRIALPLAGLAVFFLYPVVANYFPTANKALFIASLGLPPLSAGVLLITSWRLDRASRVNREAEV